MAVISIATEWASDLKTGYCTAGWWLNRKFCCWEFMEGGGPGGTSPVPSSLKPSGGAGNATMLARAGEALEWGVALVQRAEVDGRELGGLRRLRGESHAAGRRVAS